MIILTVAPREWLHTVILTDMRRVRLVRDEYWAYYTASLKTGAQQVYAKFAWAELHRQEIDGFVRLPEKEDDPRMPRVEGVCEARGCTREAFVRVRCTVGPWPAQFCDWSLLVCAKHEEPARLRLAEHILECTEGSGTRSCTICDKIIDYGETYQRNPDDSTTFVHVYCLTGDGPGDMVLAGTKKTRTNHEGELDMATATKAKEKARKPKAADEETDELPEDLEEVTPARAASAQLPDDDEDEAEDEEDEKPAKVKASKNGKSNGKASAKASKVEAKAKPAAKAETKGENIAKKADKAVKGESRATVIKAPDGDTAVVGLIPGKEIRLRLHSHAVAQWRQAVGKDKELKEILDRQMYCYVIRSIDEADALIESATNIAENKKTPPHFAKAMTRAVENIERWRKTIKSFK